MIVAYIFRIIALFLILSVAGPVRAEDKDASSFITVRSVKSSDDGAGNEQDDIVVSNRHKSRVIRVTVGWISVARERETDVNLKPGQKKTIARNQANAREIHVAQAQFK